MTISRKTAAAVIIGILLKRKQKNRRRKRIWTRTWILRRESEDITRKLISELRSEDPQAFKEMFRMTGDQFDFILEKIRSIISKKDTNMRKAISSETRLMITLKYLSTGDSYRSLTHLFRVPHNTICGIVSSTCKAIYSTLSRDFLKVI